MSQPSDAELLAAFRASNDRATLERIVRRHIGFVYASACRQVRSPHLAEDITQAVFIVFTRKANGIRSDVVLRDWLFVTTRFAVKNALRAERRRAHHERLAAMRRVEAIVSSAESRFAELSPLLDEGIASLGESERRGLLLSFFDDLPHRRVGLALGISEDAARKRVARAVEKLRAFFASRGVAVGESTLTAALRTTAAAPTVVPAATVQSVLAAALATTATDVAVTGASSFAIVKGVTRMFVVAKLKLAAAVAAACLIACGSGAAIVAGAWAADPKPAPPASQPAVTVADGAPAIARFDDNVAVEILGVAHWPPPGKEWWDASGRLIDRPCDTEFMGQFTGHTHLLCLRAVDVPDDAGIVWLMPDARGWTSQPATKDGAPLEHAHSIAIAFPQDQPSTEIRCRIATGPWETVIELQGADSFSCRDTEFGGVAMGPAYQHNNQTAVTVTFGSPESQARVLAIDNTGAEHVGAALMSGTTKTFMQMTVAFDVPIDQIDRLLLQARPYDHIAEFKNVSLDPAKRTTVEVSAKRK